MDRPQHDRMEFAKHLERAQGWLLLDQADEAARSLERIPAAFHQTAAVLAVRGLLYMRTRQWALAAPVFRRLLELDDQDPQTWVSLAYALRRARSIAEAEPVLLEARRRFPTVGVICYNLACYAAQQARLREAHELLREAIRLEPGFEKSARADPDLTPYWEGHLPAGGADG